MRLKAFSAPTMTLAMAQVRQVLGNDAVIVSTRHGATDGGVVVTAAIEKDPVIGGKETFSACFDGADHHDTVEAVLDFHHVPSPAADLLRAAASTLEADNPVALLAGALDLQFVFHPVALTGGTVITLIGPPGAGKTVAAAKIAASILLSGYPVRLVNADTGRAGAGARIKALSERLELPLEDVHDREALLATLRNPSGEVVVVDTPGINPLDEGEFEELHQFLAGIETLRALVLAAGGDAFDCIDHATAFTALGADSLIVTRLDATLRYGGLLAAAHATRLPFAASGICPEIGEGLSSLNPMSLARILVSRSNGSSPVFSSHKAAT